LFLQETGDEARNQLSEMKIFFTSEDDAMKVTGDRPGKGTYVCMTCGQKIVIKDDEEKLPVCPKCHGSMWH